MHGALFLRKASEPDRRAETGGATDRRILVVDDHSFYSRCLRRLIEREPGLTVCALVSCPIEALEEARRWRPHLLVVDLSVGRLGGLEAAAYLRAAGIAAPLLFISSGEALDAAELAQFAPAAFAPKAGDPAGLIALISELSRQDSPLDAAALAAPAVA